MAWFKVDDTLAFNAKVVAAGNDAMGLWVRAGAWCASQLMDGFVPNAIALAMANAMASGDDIASLVACGLWHEVDGGYMFHDWAEYQPDAEQVREQRRRRSQAGKRGAERRWGEANAMANAMAPAIANAMAKRCPVPSRPVPVEEHTSTGVDGDDGALIPADPEPAKRTAYPADFEEFWGAYPKKADKRAALEAWRAAIKRTTKARLIEAAIAYAADPGRRPQFTKNAATWLRADSWENGPMPTSPDPVSRNGIDWNAKLAAALETERNAS